MPTDPGRDQPRIFLAVPMRPGTGHQPPVIDAAHREAELALDTLDVRLDRDATEVLDPQAYDDPDAARDACAALRARQLPMDAAWLIVTGTVR